MHMISPAEAEDLFPLMSRDGVLGAALHPVRRPCRSGQPVPGDRQGCAHARRDHSARALKSPASRARGTPHQRRRDHRGPDRGRDRRARRRHVEPRAGRLPRRHRAGLRARTPVHRDRADPRHARRVTQHARPRPPGLLQARRRRPPSDRRLRGQHRAVRRERHSRKASRSSSCPRTSSVSSRLRRSPARSPRSSTRSAYAR